MNCLVEYKFVSHNIVCALHLLHHYVSF